MLHSDRLNWRKDSDPARAANPLDGRRGLWLDSELRPATTWQKATVDDNSRQPNFAKELHRLPEARRQLIFRIRRQIAEGTYDEERRFELALGRLIDTVAGDRST